MGKRGRMETLCMFTSTRIHPDSESAGRASASPLAIMAVAGILALLLVLFLGAPQLAYADDADGLDTDSPAASADGTSPDIASGLDDTTADDNPDSSPVGEEPTVLPEDGEEGIEGDAADAVSGDAVVEEAPDVDTAMAITEDEPDEQAASPFTVNFSDDYSYVAVSISGAADNASKVRFAVWSAHEGQDDTVWYEATKNPNGNIWYARVSLANHKDAGEYHVHCYATVNGTLKFSGSTTFEVEAPTAAVEITSVDEVAGTYTVTVSGIESASGVSTVYLPTWTTSNQSDIKWLETTANGDGTYSRTIAMSRFDWRAGTYHTHCYVVGGNGVMSHVGSLNCDMALPAQSVTAVLGDTESTATITVSAPKASSVRVPVWSSEGGQDDLVWYNAVKQANGTWKVTVPIKDHGSPGAYQVHCYATLSGVQSFVGSTTFEVTVPTATVEVTDVNDGEGTFTVRVSGIESPSPVTKVQLPTWVRNDQSDIRWYTAAEQADGSYTLTVPMSDHSWLTGMYHTHCYLTLANGTTACVARADQEMALPDETVYVRLADNERSVTLFAKAPSASSVSFPVWSNVGGQDDIVWYKATRNAQGVWTATVPISRHADTGAYQVHCYAKNGGSQTCIGGASFEISAPSGTFAVSAVDEVRGTYTVTLSGIENPSGVTKVLLPTWAMDDRSDIKWYTGVMQDDGSYAFTIPMADHAWRAGTYRTHCYVAGSNGVQACVGTLTQDMSKPAKSVTATLNDEETYATVVAVVPDTSVTAVSIPVWSNAGGQDDLVWYTAKKQSDGTWVATVPIGKHRTSGEYQVHCYTGTTNRVRVADTTFAVDEFSAIDGCYAVIVDTKKKTSARIDVTVISGVRYLFLPSCADLSNLELYFENGDGTVTALVAGTAGGDYVEAGEGVKVNLATMNSLGKNGQYVFYYRDDESTVPVRVTVMKSLGIRTVFIVSDDPVNQGRGWIEDDIGHDRKASGTIIILDEEGKLLNSKSQDLEYIRGRGNSTWRQADKKPYQIKLDKKADLLDTGMGAKKWVLLANAGDATLLHTTIALNLAREMGLSETPECAPCDLYYDGEYRGSYLLCEKVDIAEYSVPIYDLEGDNEDVNEGVDLESRPTAIATNKYGMKFKYTTGIATPADYSGGYLVELDDVYYRYEAAWFETPAGYFVVKTPEFLSRTEMEYISCYVYEATQCVSNGGSVVAGGTTRHTSDYFDVDSLARMYLLNEFSKNIDAYCSSTYFFLPSHGDAMSGNYEHKLYAGPAWDYDGAFGIRGDAALGTLGYSYQGYVLTIRNLYPPDDPSVQTMLKNYYRNEFKGMIESVVLGGVNAQGEVLHSLAYYHAEITASQRMDEKLWGVTNLPANLRAYAGYQANVDHMRDFIYYRNQWLAGDVAKWNGSPISNPTTVYDDINYGVVFDYNYYVNRYKDVVAVVGASPEAVLRHFVEYGIREGRQGTASFNAQTYFHNYADLRAAFGTNLIELTRHYIEHGFLEGRKGI